MRQNNEMEVAAFTQEKTEEVRHQLGVAENLDDEVAMDYIIMSVFDDDRSSHFSDNQLDLIIDSIFYKTRRRLGILQPLIEDESVSEIMVNGADDIFVEREGKIERHTHRFESTEELEEVMRNIAGDVHREINERNPIVDARLNDGSRVNGVYKNIAINGPILTIRKFSDKYMKMEDLIRNGTISSDGAELLKTLVFCGYNIFVSGGTSSGKTTLLNALAEAIPKDERVIVVEDSAELKMNYIENIVHMEARSGNNIGSKISMSDLIRSSLRMRPNRIIVGEVRGAEVLDMLQAMNTGHSGSMSTGHGNSVKGMLKRLESMYLMAMTINIEAIRGQIAEGIDIMVHIQKLENGKRRVTEIVELAGFLKDDYILNCLMKLDENGQLISTGNKIIKNERLTLKGRNTGYVL